jgi:hypothetical protein
MSMTEHEYAFDEYMSQLYEEHKAEAIEEFTAERLQSYYTDNRLLAKPAFCMFSEAQTLIDVNPTAGFVFAAIAMEVGLKEILLKPIVFGLVHVASFASLVTNLVMSHHSMDRYKDLLLQILRDHGGVDLQIYRRSSSVKTIWEEIKNVQTKRNHILHTAQKAFHEDAKLALGVASTIINELFPAVVTRMGLHLHDGYRICDDWKCKYEGTEIGKILKTTEPGEQPIGHKRPLVEIFVGQ